MFNYIANRPDSAVVRKVVGVANRIRKAQFNSSNHDIYTNGERDVLQACVNQKESGRPFVIFDVGANEGQWAEVALSTCPDCQLHAFEIVPSTRAELEKAIGGRPNVLINDAGLSDKNEEVELQYYPGNSTGTSAYELPWNCKPELLIAECQRGDDYVKRNGIDHIDFLKIDVEGMDYKVISGFLETIASGRVDAIQFEYNAAAAVSRCLLKDYYDLLEAHGYQLGRIFPNRVEFKEYNVFNDENFLQCNFFAAREELTAKIRWA
ncbi:FkbM family methyltransferase [Rhodopirellula sp. MGV]|uniref:FkbM family methyltransferase n=1 Tax=Rhodopirellula sp. MGV TaxID=2023130 RepID=UPI000B972CF9|nr:FkbM family methyltransferase [Rhodopirellula sp. MGV]OYP37323.1 hypothetical protein CGZ80_05465 [Rhodopirellula sp. MGV]PNY36413.1 FkbM family methyltransferase [Rhodopirellula baltica]